MRRLSTHIALFPAALLLSGCATTQSRHGANQPDWTTLRQTLGQDNSAANSPAASRSTFASYSPFSLASAHGFCWPVLGRISRGFTGGHKGLDICISEGTPVAAAASGKVLYAGNKLSGYGNVVILDHGNGIASIYGHNSRNLVCTGQSIARGQTISLVGQTGNATTPHCHFEVRNHGCAVDPRPLLP